MGKFKKSKSTGTINVSRSFYIVYRNDGSICG